ncbi:RimK/LysX family protein [Planktotalea sp.]|uniref:putative ATP-dependent zinc protease n=1 Tax=Planktotalea sp. TaxID=2029877 RepID=UPI0035C8785C
MKNEPKHASQLLSVIGWGECISLPELGLNDFAIKVDTGAKTTALHAEDIAVFHKEGVKWVRFRPPCTALCNRLANFRCSPNAILPIPAGRQKHASLFARLWSLLAANGKLIFH